MSKGIGTDSESWALGCSGRVWHQGKGADLFPSLQKGDIITVILEKFRGNLKFELNRQHSDWQFEKIKALKEIALSPVVNLAAGSQVRILN